MDLISLSEVVHIVADGVPIPENWEDRVIGDGNAQWLPEDLLSDVIKLKSNMLNVVFKSAYRESLAAGALDWCLDSSSEDVLPWYDSGPTGWPKVSASARKDGLAILVHMSRYYERYDKVYKLGKFADLSGVESTSISDGKYAKKDDAQRLSEIKFERSKLIARLNEFKIPHSLEISSHPVLDRNAESVLLDESASLACELNTATHIGAEEAISVQNTTIEVPKNGRTVHRTNNTKRPLDDLILQAQVIAGDKNKRDVNLVYSILTQMVKSDRPPLPLLGFEEREGIKYQSGRNTKYYTERALTRKIKPESRGKKKKAKTDLVGK